MGIANVLILKIQWILFLSNVLGYSKNGRLTNSGDSITGYFMEKDLSPTLAKHGPEKFINITVEEGVSELILQCDEGERRIAWYKDGLRLRSSLRFQINSTGNLRILDVNKDQTGIYRCFTDLNTAKLRRSYSIQVAYKPVVLSHFAKSVYLSSGQSGHLVCCLSGFPAISEVIWHRQAPANIVMDPELDDNNATEMQVVSERPFPVEQLVKSEHHFNDVLCFKKLIPYVSPELSGTYTCQGKNALGWGQRSMTFSVFVQVRPYFTQKPEIHPDQRVPFSEILQSCKADGFPSPEITWMQFILKTPKHMKRNITTTFEMPKSGDEWLFCPSDSATLCWRAKKVELLTKSLKCVQKIGIFACMASNDVGFRIALSNPVDPEKSSQWQFALGIDIMDSLACGLRIMMEVFTWAPSVLPKKIMLEHFECSFLVEFSISLREEQWRTEQISLTSVRSGKFEILGLASNTLTAVRVRMSCSSGQPVMSNTVHGWTKATANDTNCSPAPSSHGRSKGDPDVSVSAPPPVQYPNLSVKVLLVCGSLVLILLSIFAFLLMRHGVRIRARKFRLSRNVYFPPQHISSWTYRCNDSPAIYTIAATTNNTVCSEGDFKLTSRVPMKETLLSELGINRLGESQTVTVINNSIEEFAVLKKIPTERLSTSRSSRFRIGDPPMYESVGASTLAKIDVRSSRSRANTQPQSSLVKLPEAVVFSHYSPCGLRPCQIKERESLSEGVLHMKCLSEDPADCQNLASKEDTNCLNI